MQVDPASAASWVFDRLGKASAQIHRAADPCMLPKACKNAVELDGTREAHRRDGAAVTRFLAWLAREAPKGGLREIAASDRLEAFRKEGKYFRDLSFPTISGAGSNGAIVHYRASPETEKRLEPGTLYSARFRRAIPRRHHRHHPHHCDRQAKRRDARELHPRAQGPYRAGDRAFSRKAPPARSSTGSPGARCGRSGSITTTAPATASAATSRCMRDRSASRRRRTRSRCCPGMIVSNEPGYYKTGAYGIRIENLIVVQPDKHEAERRDVLLRDHHPGADRP